MECVAKYRRDRAAGTAVPPSTSAGEMRPLGKRPDAQLSEAPPPWQPRPGWGTVRDYLVVTNDSGGTDVACRFVFDDGSEPVQLIFRDNSAIAEMGEYARGIMMTDDELTIKVDSEGVAQAEQVLQRINGMEAAKRALMYAGHNDLSGDCGWAWTPEYKLVKAAPGLTS